MKSSRKKLRGKKTSASKALRKAHKLKAPSGKTTPQKSPAITLTKILVPIDFSEYARKALQYAIPFARQFKAKLYLVYVVEPTIYPADFSFGQVGLPNVEAELRTKAEEELKELVEKEIQGEVESEWLVKTGLPFVEIASFAKDENIDLIIVATHGHTGVEHILFGSTAEKIVRKAPCPVLVVRSDERDFVDERV
ncbi:MAG: universal stress protein [Bacteroidota bacterium]|nr:universal stress protein [Bacteroidota bacterium]